MGAGFEQDTGYKILIENEKYLHSKIMCYAATKTFDSEEKAASYKVLNVIHERLHDG